MEWMRNQSDKYLLDTLKEGTKGVGMEWDSLGNILEGNHRAQVLLERGWSLCNIKRSFVEMSGYLPYIVLEGGVNRLKEEGRRTGRASG
jgi:hypothetical protein